MHTDVASLQDAKRVVQFMAIGILPSQENARLARATLTQAAAQARVVLGAMDMGVGARVGLCRDAVAEIDVAIEQARELANETSGAELRQRFERGG